MKKILFFLLIQIITTKAFCSDTLCVVFENSFKNDSVKLYLDKELVFQGVIITNVISGFAEVVEIPIKYNNHELFVSIGNDISKMV